MIKRICNASMLNKTAVFLLCVTLISLIPIFHIANYAHPSGDDYTYGSYTHGVWEDTGSVFETVKAGIHASGERWQNWQGTHTAIFIMTMMPAVFDYSAYPIGAILLILIFILSAFFFFDTIFKKVLRLERAWSVIFACIFIFSSVQFMPSIVEGFYWFNGAWYYTFYFCLAMVMFSVWGRLILTEKQWVKITLSVTAIILALFIGGGNYPLVLITILISAVITICLFLKKKPAKWVSLVTFGCVTASFLVSALAPGNSVRAEFNEGMHPIKAIIFSFYHALKSVFSQLSGLFLVIIVVMIPLFFMLAKEITKKTKFQFKSPLAVLGLSFCIFATMFCPTLFAMGNIGPGRIQDIYYYASIIFILLNCVYICGWLSNKHNVKFKAKETICILFVGGLLLLSGCDYDDFYSLNSVQAAKQLMDGSAQAHSQEMYARQEILTDENISQVILEPLENKPSVIFLWDIKANSSIWRNEDMAKYYGKKTVVLSYDDGGY